jgi:hypothetical protein
MVFDALRSVHIAGKLEPLEQIHDDNVGTGLTLRESGYFRQKRKCVTNRNESKRIK